MTTPDASVAAVAATQAAAVSRSQALACGVSHRMIDARVRSGRWRRVHPGVYVLAGAPPGWATTLWSVCLAVGPGAVVTHETALVLHGVPDSLVPRQPVTCTDRHGRHHRVAGATVHQIDDLRPEDVMTDGCGVPVSTPARAVAEVAGTQAARHLAAVVDHVLVERITTPARVADALAAIARPGKPGVRKLALVLDARGPGEVPPQSVLEATLFSILERSGLPRPRRQAPLPGRGAVRGLVDAAYDDARVIIEVDGRRWHTRVRDLARDHERDAEAARAGWLTLRLLVEHVRGDPDEVCALISDVRATRLPTPGRVA